jgi:hypothetical protein
MQQHHPNKFRAAKSLCVPRSFARFARKKIERSEIMQSEKSKGGNGFVSIPISFANATTSSKQISRSEIPLRTSLLCALCEKKNQAPREKNHAHHHNQRSSVFQQ